MTKIGIIGAGTGALPPEVLKMAEEANPKPQEQFTYVPMLWEVPHEPEQAPQPKEKIIRMNPKK